MIHERIHEIRFKSLKNNEIKEKGNGVQKYSIISMSPVALDELLFLSPLLSMAVAHHAPTTELFERLENVFVGRACPMPEACIFD